MRPPHRNPSRAAVAKSLRDLETLFGKKPPPEKDNAHGKVGADGAVLTRQPKAGVPL